MEGLDRGTGTGTEGDRGTGTPGTNDLKTVCLPQQLAWVDGFRGQFT